MGSVASALSQSESRLFLLLWAWRWITVGSSGAVPWGNYWGSHEGWVFQFSLWLEYCWLLPCLPQGLRTRGVMAPSHGFRVSTGWFWLLGAGIRTVSPLLFLASSHSGICAMRVGVPSCSLAHCGAPWLVAIASLPLVSRPWTVLSWSHLCGRPSHGSTAPFDWLRGVFPCFGHLPSFWLYEAAFLWVLCIDIAPSLRDEVTLPGRVCLSPRSQQRLFLHLPGVW